MEKNWRRSAFGQLNQEWDVLIIGGGITGAGIFQRCVQMGLKAALVEAGDFASGSSSRSSKLVHGGLRYLKNAQIKVTLESVREREQLLRQGQGLINRLGFLYTCLEGDRMPGWIFRSGLIIYDLMAGQWSHQAYDAEEVRRLCPTITSPLLRKGYRYFDAITDDARLVLRLIFDATAKGGLALNYARVENLVQNQHKNVVGIIVRDLINEQVSLYEVRARVVINASGAWADEIRGWLGRPARLRPLRGSHLIFPFERLPITRAVSFLHPKDGRPVFALPWEGVVLFGTTDVDHRASITTDPCLDSEEAQYLLEGVQTVFPQQNLSYEDVLSVYSGLRPVVNTGKSNPSKESREHVIWEENGLITVSGGKLTTFRIMARDALRMAYRTLGHFSFQRDSAIFETTDEESENILRECGLAAWQRLHLLARYGNDFARYYASVNHMEKGLMPGTPYLWAELGYAAQNEAVVHLEDLMLRRLRLGIILRQGGMDLMPKIKKLIQPKLGWDDVRWGVELREYRRLIEKVYTLAG